MMEWKGLLIDPSKYGWYSSDNKWKPKFFNTYNQKICPDFLSTIAYCSCQGDCSTLRCKCRANGGFCTLSCRNCESNCTNHYVSELNNNFEEEGELD